MDRIDNYRKIIQSILSAHSAIPYAYGDIQIKTVFDETRDEYLLMIHGWENERRVHGCIVHVNLIKDKFWIQRDGTEYGIANELVDNGVPKEHIVLGFHSLAIRPHTEFAIE